MKVNDLSMDYDKLDKTNKSMDSYENRTINGDFIFSELFYKKDSIPNKESEFFENMNNLNNISSFSENQEQ
jgi:hypothetical protein